MAQLHKAIKDFLSYCRFEKNLSAHTLKAYHLDLIHFANFVSPGGKKLTIEEIDKKILRQYLQQLLTQKKIKTVKRKIATVRALFNYLEYEDAIEVNPFRRLRIKIKEPLQLPRVLTLLEVKSLFKTAYNEKEQYKDPASYTYKAITRDIVALELLFATGIRVSELCNLEKQDVNLEQKYIKVRGKGNRERIIQLCSPEIVIILEKYIGLFHPPHTDFQFFFINRLGNRLSEQSVRFMIGKYARLAGLKKAITPHTLRHTFATLLLEEGVDIRYIQQLLGHSTITTTQIYTHVTQDKQKKILSTLHPRAHFRLEK
jgi:integrase/recombinase XerD